MYTAGNASYETILILEDGTQLNATQAVENLGWEENEDELAMKISFDMYNGVYGGKRLSTLVKPGVVVAIKADWGIGKGIVAIGNVTERTRKSTKTEEVISIVAYDNLFNLQKSSDCVYFAKGKKTKSILNSIMKSWGLSISRYSGPNVSHSRILEKNKRIGDIIRDVLDEAKKKGGGSAILRCTQNKIEVVKKGSNTTIYAFQGINTIEASHTSDISDMVTRVKIISQEDSDSAAKIEATVNGNTKYGVFQKIITKSKSDTLAEAKKEAKEILNEDGKVKLTSKLVAPDVPPIRKGDVIYAKVCALGGYYLVKSVQHNAKSGKITMDIGEYDLNI